MDEDIRLIFKSFSKVFHKLHSFLNTKRCLQPLSPLSSIYGNTTHFFDPAVGQVSVVIRPRRWSSVTGHGRPCTTNDPWWRSRFGRWANVKDTEKIHTWNLSTWVKAYHYLAWFKNMFDPLFREMLGKGLNLSPITFRCPLKLICRSHFVERSSRCSIVTPLRSCFINKVRWNMLSTKSFSYDTNYKLTYLLNSVSK